MRRLRGPGFLFVAGILQLILAVIILPFGFIFSLFSIHTLFGVFFHELWKNYGIPYWFYAQLGVGIVGLVAFVFGLAGGISALRRTRFYLSFVAPPAIITWAVILVEYVRVLTPLGDPVSGFLSATALILLAVLSLALVTVAKKTFT